MAESNRFRDAKLFCFSEQTDPAAQTDFCALHIALGDGTVYVAFRGTSDSLVGWREDFSMSFQRMPSQELAADYLRETMEQGGVRYRVGGHSKGGNLAVYAAMMLPQEKQEQLLQVYSNDGPGLCPELVDMKRYRGISHKLTRIVPEFCVIGALFEQEPPAKIVKSSASGFYQHDGVTWQVEGDSFCTCPSLSKECAFYNQVFDQWIESADMEQRKAFTRDLFDALESSGARKRTDLSQGGFDGFESILLSVIQSEEKTKIVFGKLLRSLFSAFRSVQFAALFREKETIQGIVCFLAGLFFVTVPEFAARCVGTGAGVAGVVWLGKRVCSSAFCSQGEEGAARGKLVLDLALMCAIAFLMGQGTILLYLSNYLMGGFFLFASYRWAQKGFRRTLPMRSRVVRMAFAAATFLLGMVPVITAGLVLWRYVFYSRDLPPALRRGEAGARHV